MITKIGRPLMKLLKAAYFANQPVLLVGPHGIGKSQSIESLAHELNIGCEIYDLSIMEPVDLAGIPVVKQDRLHYAAPKRLPTKGKGILLFEELNRVSKDLQTACLQICTARRFNDYALPDGWVPMAAINPPSEDQDNAI